MIALLLIFASSLGSLPGKDNFQDEPKKRAAATALRADAYPGFIWIDWKSAPNVSGYRLKMKVPGNRKYVEVDRPTEWEKETHAWVKVSLRTKGTYRFRVVSYDKRHRALNESEEVLVKAKTVSKSTSNTIFGHSRHGVIVLRWHPFGGETDRKLALYRRKSHEKKWRAYAWLGKGAQEYRDRHVKAGERWEYRLVSRSTYDFLTSAVRVVVVSR